MNKNEYTLELRDLSVGYYSKLGKKPVLQHISGNLPQGTMTCLIGCNGVGKSTLLKTICSFLKPISGEVRVCDKSLTHYSEADLAKLISVVLTDRIQLQHLTTDALIAMGRSPYTGFWGRLSDADLKIVDEAFKLVHIEHLHGKTMDCLSDGERQRVLIAKALAQQTPIIILDEPTAFLDFPGRVGMMRLLFQLAHCMHKTILLSTHDVELALQIADQLWVVNQGGLVSGTPQSLMDEGQLRFLFEGGDLKSARNEILRTQKQHLEQME